MAREISKELINLNVGGNGEKLLDRHRQCLPRFNTTCSNLGLLLPHNICSHGKVQRDLIKVDLEDKNQIFQGIYITRLNITVLASLWSLMCLVTGSKVLCSMSKKTSKISVACCFPVKDSSLSLEKPSRSACPFGRTPVLAALLVDSLNVILHEQGCVMKS